MRGYFLALSEETGERTNSHLFFVLWEIGMEPRQLNIHASGTFLLFRESVSHVSRHAMSEKGQRQRNPT